MPFFESKQTLYFILSLLVIPIICCAIFYYLKPKLLWLSPIVIFGVFLIISALFYPYYFEDIFKNEYDFTTLYWIMYYFPVQITASIFFPGLTYIICKIRIRY